MTSFGQNILGFGSGGGANGAIAANTGSNASANLGGGGGGGGGNWSAQRGTGGNGGSGLVILRIPTANLSGTTAGSPSSATDGDFTVLTYTSSGSYTA